MTLLPDQEESRRIVSLLAYEAMRQNQRGDSKKREPCAVLQSTRRVPLGDEPFLISQLIRIAGVVHTC